MLKNNFELMARYNQWVNNKLYDCAASLSADELTQDRGAFFGSIIGTLNHILVADIIWLKRFALHPNHLESLDKLTEVEQPARLNDIFHEDLQALTAARRWLDEHIIELSREVSAEDLASNLEYSDIAGNPYSNVFGELLQHFFNHQTHHRGQLTTLFSQCHVDVGVTDLLMTIRNGDL